MISNVFAVAILLLASQTIDVVGQQVLGWSEPSFGAVSGASALQPMVTSGMAASTFQPAPQPTNPPTPREVAEAQGYVLGSGEECGAWGCGLVLKEPALQEAHYTDFQNWAYSSMQCGYGYQRDESGHCAPLAWYTEVGCYETKIIKETFTQVVVEQCTPHTVTAIYYQTLVETLVHTATVTETATKVETQVATQVVPTTVVQTQTAVSTTQNNVTATQTETQQVVQTEVQQVIQTQVLTETVAQPVTIAITATQTEQQLVTQTEAITLVETAVETLPITILETKIETQQQLVTETAQVTQLATVTEAQTVTATATATVAEVLSPQAPGDDLAACAHACEAQWGAIVYPTVAPVAPCHGDSCSWAPSVEYPSQDYTDGCISGACKKRRLDIPA